MTNYKYTLGLSHIVLTQRGIWLTRPRLGSLCIWLDGTSPRNHPCPIKSTIAFQEFPSTYCYAPLWILLYNMQLGITAASLQFGSNIFWSRVGICNDIVAGWFDEKFWREDATRHTSRVSSFLSRAPGSNKAYYTLPPAWQHKVDCRIPNVSIRFLSYTDR